MTSNHSVGNCSMSPIDLSTIPDNITDKVTNSNHKPTKSLLSMKPPGMSNVQYCWSARTLTRTPSPDNADDVLLDEMMIRDKLDMEGLLKYQESQAHHVAKFTPDEQVKLASAREKYVSYRSVIDSGKKRAASIVATSFESNSDSDIATDEVELSSIIPEIIQPTFEPNQLLSSSSDDESDLNHELTNSILSRGTSNLGHIMHKPSFYDDMLLDTDNLDTVATFFQKANWITPDLQTEIKRHFPTVFEMTTDPNTGIITYSKADYSQKCKMLFPPGRVFCNFKQLHQTAEVFNLAWHVHKIVNSNGIHCAYKKNKRLYPKKNIV